MVTETAAATMKTQRHILIVEDDDPIRALFGDLVGALAHRADLARDGAEALEMFDPDLHDVVITDLLMPGMTGLDVIQELRRRRPDTEVIVISGSDLDLLHRADMLQVTRLRKPVDLDHFYAAVNAALSRSSVSPGARA